MPTITIVFRGLLVLNQHHVDRKPSMEIGILEEHHHHVPRIMTFRNGVREQTVLIDMEHPSVLWKLVVDDPINTGVTLRQNGPFNRLTGTGRPDDFRWIINLENAEFPYGDIDENFELDRNELKHVVQITSGEFYTRLKSPALARSENGNDPVEFGAVAGVMGLDIKVNSGGARLIGENEDDVIFEFSADANVLYEFANSPADIETEPVDHFPHYYEIFKNQPPKKYGFERKPLMGAGAETGPNPALCGKIFLSEFDGSLVSAEEESSSTVTTTLATETGHAHAMAAEPSAEQYTAAKK
jgi:hypothetical protein